MGGKSNIKIVHDRIPKPSQEVIQYAADQLRIWYTNADSLVNKLDELQTRVYNGKVDIIVITEALPKHSSFKLQEQELKIKGFASISNFDCAHEQNGRGIIIYVMDGLISVKREVKVSFNEHLVVDITLPSKKEIIRG